MSRPNTRDHVFRLTDTEQALYELRLEKPPDMKVREFLKALKVGPHTLQIAINKVRGNKAWETEQEMGKQQSLKKAHGGSCMKH